MIAALPLPTANPPNVRALLIQARTFIADPQHWTQGTAARRPNGDGIDLLACDARDPLAVSVCSIGAIMRALPYGGAITLEAGAFQALEAVLKLRPKKYDGMISTYNDNSAHPEVLAMFDAAIAAQPAGA